MMAFDYHQVIDTDRWGARGGSNRISSTNALPARHVETITRLHNLIERLGAHVKILIVSHIHGSVVNEQNLVTTVQYSQLPVDCNSNMLQICIFIPWILPCHFPLDFNIGCRNLTQHVAAAKRTSVWT